MDIAVSTCGKNLDSFFNPAFGCSPGFLVYDTVANKTAYLDNAENSGYFPGTDLQTAGLLAQAGPGVLITGALTPETIRELNRRNISIYRGFPGTVKHSLKAFQKNRLPELTPLQISAGTPDGDRS